MDMILKVHIWLILAITFNIIHTSIHVISFLDYDKKRLGLIDGAVGYLGAFFVFLVLYRSRNTVSLSKIPAMIGGILIFTLGIYIHFKAQLDFNRYEKKMQLIDKGIYSRFKHPMYVGWVTAVLGATFAARSYLGLFTSWIWILLIAVCAYLEERELKESLPDGMYQRYSKGKLF